MATLGYSTITLTDLTNALPITLTLESNQPNNVQTKNGRQYSPNFTEGDGVIITPSLFLGQEEIALRDNYVKPNGRTSGYIYYEIGGDTYFYGKLRNDDDPNIYVDENGCLHYKENLIQNITIEAYIEDFDVPAHAYQTPLVSATNPITLLLLEEGSNVYNAVITTGGRIHFEDTQTTPITMTAKLMKGTTEVNSVSYSWTKLGEDGVIGTLTSYEVVRSDVVNRAYYICKITETTTHNEYVVSQFIYDFTDVYNCEIEYNKMPILTSSDAQIDFEAKVWDGGNVVNAQDSTRTFTYEWGAMTRDGTEYTLNSETKTYNLRMSNITNKMKTQDFILYCKVYREDGIQIATGTINVYHSVQYSVKISPQTIFIPTAANGEYQGDAGKAYTFDFSLRDTAGNLLDASSSEGPQNNQSLGYGMSLNFSRATSGKFHYTGTISLGSGLEFWSNTNNNKDDLLCEFSYVYKGQTFYDQVIIVKSRAGAEGPAFSGYVVDLSNNFHSFLGTGNVVDANQVASTDINAFYGADRVDVLEVSIQGGATIYRRGQTTTAAQNVNGGLTVSTSESSGVVSIIISTGSSAKTLNNDNINFIIKVSANGHEMNVIQNFSYIINSEAAYYISTSCSTIIYSSVEGTYEPSIQAGVYVSAHQKRNGNVSPFPTGILFYSYDGSSWVKFGTGGAGTIKDYANKQIIYIRLYRSEASSATSATINNYSQYLYDSETIPIITSVEGYDIGGENLIVGTKHMRSASEGGDWISGGCADIGRGDEFAVASYTGATNGWVITPRTSLDAAYKKGNFCFNFMAKSSKWPSVASGNAFSCKITFYKQNETIGSITKYFASLSDQLKTREGYAYSELPIDTWVNFYKVFTLEDIADQITEEHVAFRITIEYVQPSASTNDTLQIRKLKLDRSNVPSGWTPSFEDENEIVESINAQLESELGDLRNDLDILSLSKLTLGSEEYTLNVIENINTANLVSDSARYHPITITAENGSTYSFLTVDEFKSYIDKLNQMNARNYANYSSTLISTSLSEINNTISIQAATSSMPEGSITIKTTTYDTTKGKQYQEALRLTSNKLSFQVNKEEVAWMSGNKLFIPNAQIVDNIYFGRDITTNDPQSHLRIMTTSNGIGFIWEGQ